MKHYNNIRVLAVNNGREDGFHVYLDRSGQRDYVMTYGHNGLLYGLLRDCPSLEEIRRWRPDASRYDRLRRRQGKRLERTVDHLIDVLDEFMEYEAC